MVVFARDIVGISLLESKRDAILVVHSEAKAPGSIPLQRLQPITCGKTEILKCSRSVNRIELPPNNGPQSLR